MTTRKKVVKSFDDSLRYPIDYQIGKESDQEFWTGGFRTRITKLLTGSSIPYSIVSETAPPIDHDNDDSSSGFKVVGHKNAPVRLMDASFVQAQEQQLLPPSAAADDVVDVEEVLPQPQPQDEQQPEQQPSSSSQEEQQQEQQQPSERPVYQRPAHIKTLPVTDELKQGAGISEVTYNEHQKRIWVKDGTGNPKRSFILSITDPAPAVNYANFVAKAVEKKGWGEAEAVALGKWLFNIKEE
jgi:hypothetical protein